MCRRAPASWRTAIRRANSRSASINRALCSAPPRKRAALPARRSAGSSWTAAEGWLIIRSGEHQNRPFSMTRLIGRLDRLVAAILGAGKWLLLPVVGLLLLQWPLRDLFRGLSRDANDLGQWLFALFVAMAFTAGAPRPTHPPAHPGAR